MHPSGWREGPGAPRTYDSTPRVLLLCRIRPRGWWAGTRPAEQSASMFSGPSLEKRILFLNSGGGPRRWPTRSTFVKRYRRGNPCLSGDFCLACPGRGTPVARHNTTSLSHAWTATRRAHRAPTIERCHRHVRATAQRGGARVGGGPRGAESGGPQVPFSCVFRVFSPLVASYGYDVLEGNVRYNSKHHSKAPRGDSGPCDPTPGADVIIRTSSRDLPLRPRARPLGRPDLRALPALAGT